MGKMLKRDTELEPFIVGCVAGDMLSEWLMAQAGQQGVLSLRVPETFSNKTIWRQVPFTEVRPVVSPLRGLGIQRLAGTFVG